MTLVLIVIALVAYGVRYAYSGVDNALFYRARTAAKRIWGNYVPPDVRPFASTYITHIPVGLPDIHTAENAQSWGSHVVFAALTLAVESSWKVLLLWVAAWGVSNIASYWFNRFIWMRTKREEESYDQPGVGKIPKVFANSRQAQIAVGFVVSVACLTTYAFLVL